MDTDTTQTAQNHMRLIRPLAIDPETAGRIDRTAGDGGEALFRLRPLDGPLEPGEQFELASPHARPTNPDNDTNPDRPPDRPSDHRHDAALAMWRRVADEEGLTLEDLKAHRVKVGWRLVREIARLKGLLGPEERLIEADDLLPRTHGTTDVVFDPWVDPKIPPPSRILSIVHRVPGSERALTLLYEAHANAAVGGLALVPPDPMTPDHREAELHEFDRGYDPARDDRLQAYIELIDACAQHLRIYGGSKWAPDAGRYGMAGLTNPYTIRLAWPTRTQIYAWEEIFVRETLDHLVGRGQRITGQWLRDGHGLLEHEVVGVIAMAKSLARREAEGDLEEERALMIARLEEFADRAKESFNDRIELAALKQLAMVKGLTKAEPEDTMTEFLKIVKTAQENRLTTPPAPPQVTVE